jgi:serralysin
MKPVLCMIVILGMGCTIGDGADTPLSYEEFQAKYIGVFNDDEGIQRIYYDDEQPLESMDQVAKLYEIYLAAKVDGEQVSEATANTNVHGQVVRWNAQTAQNLTYCVSNNFGGYKNAVATAVANAGAAWASASGGRIRFVRMAQYDGNCNTGSPVVFDVNPSTNIGGAYAMAFFPGYARNQRRLLIDVSKTFNGDFPATGIMRHELGHVVGLRHETARQEAINKYGTQCYEDVYIRPLTGYDDWSVMGTPRCMGNKQKNTSLQISNGDAQGIRILYP